MRLIRNLLARGKNQHTKLVRLLARLDHGPWEDRKAALAELIALGAEDELTARLASEDARTGQLAAAGLWECWINEEGPQAREIMETGIDLLEAGDLLVAEQIFRSLSEEFPGWAEPLHKLATVLYRQGQYEESLELCHEVVDLKPNHFGAWHGLASCAVKLRHWETALAAAQEGLRLQPRFNENREIIKLSRARLAQMF